MNLIEAAEMVQNFKTDYSDKNKLPVIIKKSWNFTKIITYLPKSKLMLISDMEYNEFGMAYSKTKNTEKKLDWKDFSTDDLCADDYVVGVNRDILGRFKKEAWA